MQRRTLDKPYRRALANYPRHKEEIEQLPRKYDAVLARYPYKIFWRKKISFRSLFSIAKKLSFRLEARF